VRHQISHGSFFCNCIKGSAAKVEYILNWSSYTSENICEQFWSKHPDWKYESEWRIIWPLVHSTAHYAKLPGDTESKNYHCLRFEPMTLKRVIFGLNMDSNTQQRLFDMLNKDAFNHVRRERTEINGDTGELILNPMV
jgi:hypothetical protein